MSTATPWPRHQPTQLPWSTYETTRARAVDEALTDELGWPRGTRHDGDTGYLTMALWAAHPEHRDWAWERIDDNARRLVMVADRRCPCHRPADEAPDEAQLALDLEATTTPEAAA